MQALPPTTKPLFYALWQGITHQPMTPESKLKADLEAYFAMTGLDATTLHIGAEFGFRWAVDNYSFAESTVGLTFITGESPETGTVGSVFLDDIGAPK